MNLLGPPPPFLKHQNVTLFGNRVVAGVIIKMRAHWSRVGPSFHKAGVLPRRDTESHRRKMAI